MPAIMSSDPKHVGSAIGDRPDLSIVFHDLYLAVGPIQECAPQTNSGRLPYQLRRSSRLYQATAHTWPLRWQYPPCLHAIPANSHTRSRCPFFSGVFPFSVSKGPVGRRCGNVQETINDKLNYPDQYFVGLVPGQRSAKDRANSSAPSIWRSDD
jgi:hypothetical protein